MPTRAAEFRQRLLRWYDTGRRHLPWRISPDAPPGTRPDPYRVLVSEVMLQQTQVATAVPYFNRFIAALPDLPSLASATEQDVLRLWQGLGYYRRARLLWGTAKIVLKKYYGQIPSDPELLLSLPGIGPYTAAAIASIAFDRPVPVLDANVTRVLRRIGNIRLNPARSAVRKRLLHLAADLLHTHRPGDFNSAMMELGATVCTPRKPRCQHCPVASWCRACSAGSQQRTTPRPKPARISILHRRHILAIRRASLYLIEQRPPSGRWAGLWQFITLPAESSSPSPTQILAATGCRIQSPIKLATFRHELTHRRYEFHLYLAAHLAHRDHAPREIRPRRRWVKLSELSHYPLSRPQLRAADILRARP